MRLLRRAGSCGCARLCRVGPFTRPQEAGSEEAHARGGVRGRPRRGRVRWRRRREAAVTSSPRRRTRPAQHDLQRGQRDVLADQRGHQGRVQARRATTSWTPRRRPQASLTMSGGRTSSSERLGRRSTTRRTRSLRTSRRLNEAAQNDNQEEFEAAAKSTPEPRSGERRSGDGDRRDRLRRQLRQNQ